MSALDASAAPIGIGAWLDRRWRQAATGFCFFVFGLGGIFFGVAVFPLVCIPSVDRATAKRRAQAVVSWWFWVFANLMRSLGLITWEVHGVERLRAPGRMIIANHPSLIDVVLLIAHIPRVDCIVKEALFHNPFTRLPVRWAGYISNCTPEQLVADCAQTLRSGNSLMLFPEGTRTRPGQPIHIPHGTARIALEVRAEILPVTIHCDPPMLAKNVPFWKVPPRPGHYTITVGEPYSAAPFLDAAPSMAIAARRLSRHWERELAPAPGAALPADADVAVAK